MANRIFTSESVTEGHPDKICDQISDAILDEILAQDESARVACESIVTTGMALVMGEITTSCYVDIPSIVRNTIKNIGYDRPEYGFDYKSCAVLTQIDEQSPDISQGVNEGYENRECGESDPFNATGAGDQGMMFGFACDETKEYMPAAITFAHTLTQKLAIERKSGRLSWLRPDGKSQVTVEYSPDGKVLRIPAVVVSTQHDPDIDIEELRKEVIDKIICSTLPDNLIDSKTKFYVNPTGKFVVGGPVGDSGLTGRKIIVDTYGGYGCHGGGCFSGKDPTKVDRSAAYMARYIAKNIVASKMARKCQIEVAYAIGVAHPISVHIDTQGTGVLSDEDIANIVNKEFDLRPASIISFLDLRKPIYKKTAAYGHFGRSDILFPWERTDAVDKLSKYL